MLRREWAAYGFASPANHGGSRYRAAAADGRLPAITGASMSAQIQRQCVWSLVLHAVGMAVRPLLGALGGGVSGPVTAPPSTMCGAGPLVPLPTAVLQRGHPTWGDCCYNWWDPTWGDPTRPNGAGEERCGKWRWRVQSPTPPRGASARREVGSNLSRKVQKRNQEGATQAGSTGGQKSEL